MGLSSLEKEKATDVVAFLFLILYFQCSESRGIHWHNFRLMFRFGSYRAEEKPLVASLRDDNTSVDALCRVFGTAV